MTPRRYGARTERPVADVGLWQGALRDPAESVHAEIAAACDAGQPISVEMLYSDQVGAQRTVRRINLVPADNGRWLANSGRHWDLDRPSAR